MSRIGATPLDAERASLDADGARVRVLTVGRDIGTCFGGAEKVAFELVKRLDAERFKRYVCVTHARPQARRLVNDRELAALEEAGVGVLKLERSGLRSNLAWGKLYRLLVDARIDVVHAHMPRASVPATILARLARVPVVVSHEHGWPFEGKPVRQFLDRNVLARGSDVLLAVSERDRARMVAVERIEPERIRVLPNGIPPMEAGGDDAREELGVPARVGLIGAVGRLYPEKAYDVLIHAVATLARDGRGPVACVIAGHGPQEQALNALIAELGLGETVRLIGRRQDVPEVIRALDVAVLCSHDEGSPLAVMEYMAAGAPIVATAVGGIPELIDDGVHGLLVPPRDPVALARAIRRLLDDRALAARLGEAARARQRERFNVVVVVERLEALYLELYAASNSGNVRRTIERHV